MTDERTPRTLPSLSATAQYCNSQCALGRRVRHSLSHGLIRLLVVDDRDPALRTVPQRRRVATMKVKLQAPAPFPCPQAGILISYTVLVVGIVGMTTHRQALNSVSATQGNSIVPL